jgi:hypothetical protein
VEQELNELFGEEFSSQSLGIRVHERVDKLGAKYNEYSTILEDDILVEVFEYFEDEYKKYKSLLEEDKTGLLKLGTGEFSDLFVFKDEENRFSALVISKIGDTSFYTQGVIYIQNGLLFKLTLMTSKEEVFSRLTEKYSKQFMKV